MRRSLNRQQLNALAKRISSSGDMHIEVSNKLLALLCLTAEVPFAFGARMLELPSPMTKRWVDACALNALLLIAESKLPAEPRRLLTHTFKPNRKAPWFCDVCGYGAFETLKHHREEAA